MDEKTVEKKDPTQSDYIEVPVGKFFGKLRQNPWIVSTFVFGIVLIVVLIYGGFGKGITGNVVRGDVAGQNAVEFINSNPQLQGKVSLISVTKDESGQFYEAIVSYLEREIPVYITLDGKYLLNGAPMPLDQKFPVAPDSDTGAETEERVEVSADDDAVLGNKSAPVTIIEFSDYQCPFCRKFWNDALPQLKKEYIDTGKVKFVYRDYPLGFHEYAQKAAEATECVRKVAGNDEAFWKMHDKIFEEQAQLNEDNLKKWAKELGYNIESCLDNDETKEEVSNDFNDGQAAGVSGTPAFFVNDKLVEGAQPFSAFKQVIDAELAAAAG